LENEEFTWYDNNFHLKARLRLSNLDSYINTDDTDLDIPNVDIIKMNRDQKFAFQIALKIFIEIPTNYEPLRMIVSGTAGSGKSYLLKCLVKADELHPS
jgi:DNA replication protein DnaC